MEKTKIEAPAGTTSCIEETGDDSVYLVQPKTFEHRPHTTANEETYIKGSMKRPYAVGVDALMIDVAFRQRHPGAPLMSGGFQAESRRRRRAVGKNGEDLSKRDVRVRGGKLT